MFINIVLSGLMYIIIYNGDYLDLQIYEKSEINLNDENGYIEMTIPEKPNSSKQKYRKSTSRNSS